VKLHSTLDDWIRREAIPFSADEPASLNAAVDAVVTALSGPVDLLGFGEALHGGADILALRNRIFQRLVEAHGFSAIAIESSFPRSRLANDYVEGRGPESYEALQDIGFSHGFGAVPANRELVEWMRRYNGDPARRVRFRFYGFDSPTEMTHSDSPRHLLHFVLDYLARPGDAGDRALRERIDSLIGQDSEWENPAAMMDPSKSVGLSAAATALRIETENLDAELRMRRPELVAESGEDRYFEAVQHVSLARQFLGYHAVLALASGDRLTRLLGLRDAMMADLLMGIVSRERGRGKVFAFAHNSHLRRGRAFWQLGSESLRWWPAGAHLHAMLGSRYVVIGTAIGASEAHGLGVPEAGTLEARLAAVPGPALFIPTHRGEGLPAREIASLPVRSGSARNSTYVQPLVAQSLSEFDGLALLKSMS
jgi:erythromycin esterase-like protein